MIYKTLGTWNVYQVRTTPPPSSVTIITTTTISHYHHHNHHHTTTTYRILSTLGSNGSEKEQERLLSITRESRRKISSLQACRGRLPSKSASANSIKQDYAAAEGSYATNGACQSAVDRSRPSIVLFGRRSCAFGLKQCSEEQVYI